MEPTSNNFLFLDRSSYSREHLSEVIARTQSPAIVLLEKYFDPSNPYLTQIAKTDLKIMVLVIFNHLMETDPIESVRNDFLTLIRAKRLTEPSKLSVTGQYWFNGTCTRALITCAVKLSHLDVAATEIQESDVIELINNDVLVSPCCLVTSFGNWEYGRKRGEQHFSPKGTMPKDVAAALLRKNIQISYLYIDQNSHLSHERWCEIIQNLLVDRCSLHIDYNALNDQIIEALNDKLITISKLHLEIQFHEFSPCLDLNKLLSFLSKVKHFELTLLPGSDRLKTFRRFVEEFAEMLPIAIDKLYSFEATDILKNKVKQKIG